MTQATGRVPEGLGWVAAGYAVLIAILYAHAAALRGPWLDEFWTLWLTEPTQDRSILFQRWLSDQHPIFFNALVYSVRSILGNSIVSLRIIVNGAGLGTLLASTILFSRLSPRNIPFYSVFLVTLFAIPTTIEAFADLRSYFLQIVATAVWLQFVAYAIARDRSHPLAPAASVVGCVAAFSMIALHFIAGLQGLILYFGTAAMLYRFYNQRALWTGGAVLVACAVLLVSAAVQMPRWFRDLDFRWVTSTTFEALELYKTISLDVLFAALPIFGAGLLGFLVLRPEQRRFQCAVATSSLAAACVLLVINVVQPIAVQRYFVPQTVALSAVAAAGAAGLWAASPWFRWIMLLWTGGLCILSFNRAADYHGWDLGGAEIARLVASCPTTRVLAISGWAFGPHALTRAALREDPVFALGYRDTAARYDFSVEVVPLPSQRGTIVVTPRNCPLILWSEHTLWSSKEGQEFAAAGLRAPAGTAFRRDTATWGDLLIIASKPGRP